MNTSYFAKVKDNPNAVAITAYRPKWWKGRYCKELAPPWDMVEAYKMGKITWIQYVWGYTQNVLDRLDPQKIYDMLGQDAIITCYESMQKPGDHCHRFIVANWFNKELGIEVKEL
jgi:uncharacterized protein YeaO (DUF488 family)